MNEVKVLDILLLQYADYFVNSQGYMLLQVTNLEGNFMWLLNPKNDKYPIVVLSTENFLGAYGHDDTFDAVSEKISEQFEISNKRLELYFQDETGIPDIDNNYHREAISLGVNPSSEVMNVYSGIENVQRPIDTASLKEQYANYLKNINLGSNKRIKEVAKEKYLNNKPPKKPIATYVIMGICTLVYLLKIYLANNYDITDEIVQAIMLGGYYKAFVLGLNEWFRLLTASFVHVELLHFLMNMFALYNLGMTIETIYGPIKMLTVLLGSSVLGNLMVMIASGNGVANGISGGLYGLFAMMTLYLFQSGAFKNRRFLSRVVSIILINVAISLLPGISLFGHLGGFIAGAFLSFILINDEKWKEYRPHIIACFAILCVAMVFLVTRTQLDAAYGATDLLVGQAFQKIGISGYGRNIVTKMLEYYSTHGF